MTSGMRSFTEAAWQELGANLALCLADLDEDDYLIIESKRAPYYVQFAAQGAYGMRAEAVGNGYIDEPDAVSTQEDYARARALGWCAATDLPEGDQTADRDPDGSPNFFIDVEQPVDYGRLAEAAVRTLREVYHVRHPGLLQYRAFAFDGPEIRFPVLRIKRGRERG